jgi:hypothetical protein
MDDFKFISLRIYSQLYKKILFDLKLRRKIDILYNYHRVYNRLLGGYFVHANSGGIPDPGKKDKDFFFSFTELLAFDVFHLKPK